MTQNNVMSGLKKSKFGTNRKTKEKSNSSHKETDDDSLKIDLTGIPDHKK